MGTHGSLVLLSWRLPGRIPAMDAIPASSPRRCEAASVDTQGRDGRWFALCWLVTILGFFSISTGKRDIYILPAFPAAALLVGWSWSRWWRLTPEAVSLWAIRLPALMLALTLWGFAVVIWGSVDSLLPSRSTLLLPASPEMGLWGSLLLLVAGILLGSAAIAGQTRVMYVLIVGCTWLAMVMTVVWVYTPQFNDRYPIKSFTTEVHARVARDRPLQLCGPMNDLALRFHLGRFIPELPQSIEVIPYLEQEGEAFCIIEADWYQQTWRDHWPLLAHPGTSGVRSLNAAAHLEPMMRRSPRRQCRTTSGDRNC